MNKKELRKKILDLRSRLAADELKTQSQTICTRVTEEKVYEEAKNVCLYMPVRNEIDVSYLLKDALDSEKKYGCRRSGIMIWSSVIMMKTQSSYQVNTASLNHHLNICLNLMKEL